MSKENTTHPHTLPLKGSLTKVADNSNVTKIISAESAQVVIQMSADDLADIVNILSVISHDFEYSRLLQDEWNSVAPRERIEDIYLRLNEAVQTTDTNYSGRAKHSFSSLKNESEPCP